MLLPSFKPVFFLCLEQISASVCSLAVDSLKTYPALATKWGTGYFGDQYDNAANIHSFSRNPLLLLVFRKSLLGLVEIDAENNVDAGNKVDAEYDKRLTPAERRYLEQWKQLEVRRLLKTATESHRDKVQKFNQYLANLSEHYDIPKVGPG